ncbi:MAG TPA: NAD(P)/FAD-dependent oxidoreductase [Chryseolinea sp.]|nr:NAD(P)/FAD-dependent oxidoreductase [Chryseolinea sp.]
MLQPEVIIIGSGMGGLACGTIMAKNGYKVTVLEKNSQLGGMLQIFVRDKVIFDTGIHYVGGLCEGQNLHRLFCYLGIMDKINIRRMDEDFFDGVILGDDPVVYKFAQGYDNFIRVMTSYFPDEGDAISAFCDKIRAVCRDYPLYNFQSGGYSDTEKGSTTDTKAFLETLTNNRKLINVLAGTNLLYAGEANKTPLYIHALIMNHYIESSWKFVDGGSQIAKLLAGEIKKRGGRIIRRAHVKYLKEQDGKIIYAETDSGEKFFGDLFISNVHPRKTMDMTDSHMIRAAYRSRIGSLSNTISVFYANVVLKKNTLKYLNSNLYVLEQEDAWSAINYTEESWPQGYAIYYVASSKHTEYAEGLTVMSYMRMEEVSPWADTFNTTDHESSRGEEYEIFKKEKAERLFNAVERKIPGFRAAIASYTTATPLTARDYIGTDDGALYGFAKDYRNPLKTTLSPRTKIPNLLLTGQNINMHGVLGVTLSSVVTCGQVLGMDKLVEKIRNA